MSRSVDEPPAHVSRPCGTVTGWLREMRGGDGEAVERLWNAYFPRMTAYARRLLGRFRSRFADDEDAAASAFATFWRRYGDGDFHWVTDRESLWKLLATITARKARRQTEAERSAKRGGGRTVQASAVAADSSDADWFSLETVDVDAAGFDLIEALRESELQTIALLRLMGYDNDEIARELSLSVRTVERKLRVIRTIWLEAFAE